MTEALQPSVVEALQSKKSPDAARAKRRATSALASPGLRALVWSVSLGLATAAVMLLFSAELADLSERFQRQLLVEFSGVQRTWQALMSGDPSVTPLGCVGVLLIFLCVVRPLVAFLQVGAT